MKNILFPVLMLVSTVMSAQYYYNDIIGTEETNRQMKAFIENKVKTVTASGSDQRGVKATDFSEYQEVQENGRALRSTSISDLNRTVLYSRFDDQGRIISAVDSSAFIKSRTSYEYNAEGWLVSVQNTISDTTDGFNQSEAHHWFYNNNGKPIKMWRVIQTGTDGAKDSLEIRFTLDEDGNPEAEMTYRKNVETAYLYYYFDDKNRLSDIVRFNKKAQKLLPDIMFEYDESDRVIQKITTSSNIGSGDYLIWRYIYDEKGLKTKEALFNKDKQMTGRIDYKYTHG
jgi:antitoxin component YwqK of YwqJK toxin-antitoxin module